MERLEELLDDKLFNKAYRVFEYCSGDRTNEDITAFMNEIVSDLDKEERKKLLEIIVGTCKKIQLGEGLEAGV